MTTREVVSLLKSYGLEIDPANGELWLNGERVGLFKKPHLWICEYIPSAIGAKYDYVSQLITIIEAPQAQNRIRSLLDDLLRSSERYEDAQRNERLRNVKKYFEDQKTVRRRML